jgi:hypothetical protein
LTIAYNRRFKTRGYYGRNYGQDYGQSYGPGYGRGWCHDWSGCFQEPEGYTYLGPCRCSHGPNAYWQEKQTGRIFRGYPGSGYGFCHEPGYGRGYGWKWREPSREDLTSEMNWLKQEKEELEKRIQDLEEELKEKEKEVKEDKK